MYTCSTLLGTEKKVRYDLLMAIDHRGWRIFKDPTNTEKVVLPFAQTHSKLQKDPIAIMFISLIQFVYHFCNNLIILIQLEYRLSTASPSKSRCSFVGRFRFFTMLARIHRLLCQTIDITSLTNMPTKKTNFDLIP